MNEAHGPSGYSTSKNGQIPDGPDSIALSIENVGFTYPDGVQAVSRVDLQIPHRINTALLGPNGAGKSTLFQLIMGFVQPSEGSIKIFGEGLTHENTDLLRKRVGIVFQNPDDQLFCPTLEEDIAFGLKNMGKKGDSLSQIIETTLKKFGLWEKRKKNPYHLSHGEKKRAALATILAMNPELLLLDEPAAHLDPKSKSDLLDILHSYGGTILLVTQDLLFAGALCKRAAIMADGRIMEITSMEKLISDPVDPERFGTISVEHCKLCSHFHRVRQCKPRREIAESTQIKESQADEKSLK